MEFIKEIAKQTRARAEFDEARAENFEMSSKDNSRVLHLPLMIKCKMCSLNGNEESNIIFQPLEVIIYPTAFVS